MGDDEHGTHARASDVTLEHNDLRARTERLRIAWSETSDTTATTKRARNKLRDQAREWSALAIATLVDVCMTGDTASSRVSAASALLDRGYGKPREHLEIDATTDHAAAIAAELAALRKRPDTARALLTLAEASAQLVDKKQD